MGIPGFYKEVVLVLFGDSLTEEKIEGPISVVYLDANALVHWAASRAYGYAEDLAESLRREIAMQPEEMRRANMRIKLIDEIKRIATTLRGKTLAVIIDGLVPGPKIAQQQQRRYRSALVRAPGALFDTTAISACTPLMAEVNIWLKDEFGTNGRSYMANVIIYRSHRNTGEGEHAIIDLTRSGEIKDDGNAHVVYGRDADWFMLGGLISAQKIWLARETLDQFTNVSKFKTELAERYGVDKYDLLILGFLLGNDHCPRMAAMSDMGLGFKTALEVFKELGQHLTTTRPDGRPEINWAAYLAFMTELARKEPELLSTDKAKAESKILDQKEYADQYSAWYTRALSLRGSPTIITAAFKPSLQAEILNAAQPNQKRISDMVQSYIAMIGWMFYYYAWGTANIRFDYYYPHSQAPLLIDVATAKTLPSQGTYLRCAPGVVQKWEVETLLTSLAPQIGDYEKKMYADWLAQWEKESTEIALSGSIAGGRVAGHLFQRRMLTQLFLTIPPQSQGVLFPEVQKLFSGALALNDLRPVNFLVETPALDTKTIDMNNYEVIRKLITQRPEKYVHLPVANYRRVYVYFLQTGYPIKALEPDTPQYYRFTDQELAPYRAQPITGASTLSMTPRGGRTVTGRRPRLRVKS